MPPPKWKTWTALGLVYVVWGSTYLAIHYVVDGLPSLLTAATRFLLAAALIGGFVLLRKGTAPFRGGSRALLNSAGLGLLLLLGGNGAITLAEQRGLPSGLTALLVAAVPLYVVLLRTVLRDAPSRRTLGGVAIGFVGLGVLLLPGTRPEGVTVGAALLVLGGSALWSTGSVLASRVALPKDALVTTTAQMVGGAAGLAVAGVVRGEQLPSGSVHASSVVAFVYLVVFGSVVAFTAYTWLLGTTPVSKVSTYAYVNPVVAVVLGSLVAGEAVTPTSVVGGLITVVAVAVVVSEPPPPAVAAQEPLDLQGLERSSAT